MERIFEWVSHYGYGGLFVLLVLGIVGLPIPDETLLVVCGYLVSKGRLNPLAATLPFGASRGAGAASASAIPSVRCQNLLAVQRSKFFHMTEARLEMVHRGGSPAPGTGLSS